MTGMNVTMTTSNPYRSKIVNSVELRRNATMDAEKLLVHDGRKR